MSLEEKEQQQLKKIKDEGNLAKNIIEEILQEIGQVEQEAVKVIGAQQITEIEEMQLIIEWNKEEIKKEMDDIKVEKFEQIKEIKNRKELILKLEQLQAINIKQEMGQLEQAMKRMSNAVEYKVQQVMDQMEIITQMKKMTRNLTVTQHNQGAGQAGHNALATGHTGASAHLISQIKDQKSIMASTAHPHGSRIPLAIPQVPSKQYTFKMCQPVHKDVQDAVMSQMPKQGVPLTTTNHHQIKQRTNPNDLQQTLNDFKAAIDEAGPILKNWGKKICEIQEMAQQVRLHMQKEMDEIQQEMQQLQEQAKLIKDKAQKLQQQTELDLKEKHHMEPKQLQEPHLQYIKEQIKRINEEIQQMRNQEFEQQYAPLELLQITLIIQNQMQWIQEQAKVIERQTTKEWDKYYMKIARLAACRSKDPRTPVS